MPTDELNELISRFVAQLSPLKIYLFGSFARGTNTADSDFDFYIVVDDSQTDILGLMKLAYKAVRDIKRHPVDILVGTKSRFEERKLLPTIEQEVDREGVLLYAA